MSKKQAACLWIIMHLPDSAVKRRELLQGVLDILPAGDQIARCAREMLSNLDSFDASQKQLRLEFGGQADGQQGDGHSDLKANH